nr:unnamed protein product [Spirometra erinaceieuropaei]
MTSYNSPDASTSGRENSETSFDETGGEITSSPEEEDSVEDPSRLTAAAEYVAWFYPGLFFCFNSYILSRYLQAQAHISGVLRGCGLQARGAVSILVSYYGVCTPLYFILGFMLHMGITGLWLALIITLAFLSFIFLIMSNCLNWNAQATKVQAVIGNAIESAIFERTLGRPSEMAPLLRRRLLSQPPQNISVILENSEANVARSIEPTNERSLYSYTTNTNLVMRSSFIPMHGPAPMVLPLPTRVSRRKFKKILLLRFAILVATTIFAADEDIQEGQLIVFLLLHRKLNVREDGVELFFESQHLIPFDDDEGVIHIPSPEFRSVVSENQRLQPLKDRLGYESRNRRTHWRSLHLLVDCSVECKVRLETELQELDDLGVSEAILRFVVLLS